MTNSENRPDSTNGNQAPNSAQDAPGSNTRIALALVVLASLAGGYWLVNRGPSGTAATPQPSGSAVATANDPVAIAEATAKSVPTPENYLNLSLAYDRAGRHNDTIVAAQEALRLRPSYAEAWNNIASAYEGMGKWDEAIQAAEQAIRLKPDFQLAKNNLAWSRQQKAKAGK